MARYYSDDPIADFNRWDRDQQGLLGFPVMVTGNRTKIPRIPFLKFCGVEA